MEVCVCVIVTGLNWSEDTVTTDVLVDVSTVVDPFETADTGTSSSEVDTNDVGRVSVDTIVDGTSEVNSSVLSTVDVGWGVCTNAITATEEGWGEVSFDRHTSGPTARHTHTFSHDGTTTENGSAEEEGEREERDKPPDNVEGGGGEGSGGRKEKGGGEGGGSGRLTGWC